MRSCNHMTRDAICPQQLAHESAATTANFKQRRAIACFDSIAETLNRCLPNCLCCCATFATQQFLLCLSFPFATVHSAAQANVVRLNTRELQSTRLGRNRRHRTQRADSKPVKSRSPLTQTHRISQFTRSPFVRVDGTPRQKGKRDCRETVLIQKL